MRRKTSEQLEGEIIMPKSNKRQATQEEKHELFEGLLQTVTPVIKGWIDQADIEVEETSGHIAVEEASGVFVEKPLKVMHLSWKEPDGDLEGHGFVWVDGVFRDGFAIASFRKMVQLHLKEMKTDAQILGDAYSLLERYASEQVTSRQRNAFYKQFGSLLTAMDVLSKYLREKPEEREEHLKMHRLTARLMDTVGATINIAIPKNSRRRRQ
jgi:hypothetical protein